MTADALVVENSALLAIVFVEDDAFSLSRHQHSIPHQASSPPGHMQSVFVDTFRGNLREHVEKINADHQPLKVTGSDGADFVVISAEDWEREQETLYVVQSPSLMAPIARSATTHATGTGYRPPQDQLAEEVGAFDRL